MRTALLFPGQGAPASGRRDSVARHRPDLLEAATGLLSGEDPFEHFGEGTQFDQPAIYCASLAAFEAAGRPAADFHAGHSLGEIPALACAGAIAELDGLRAVTERGRLMAAAARESGGGGMLAVKAAAADLAEVSEETGVRAANLNSPAQTVLSGPEPAISAAAALLTERGIRTKRLAVSGAFHSPAMAPAARSFERTLEAIEVRRPKPPVISGRTGEPFRDVRAELARSLLEPVDWIGVVAWLEAEGVERFVEIGPGKALSGLVRRTASGAVEIETLGLPETTHA